MLIPLASAGFCVTEPCDTIFLPVARHVPALEGRCTSKARDSAVATSCGCLGGEVPGEAGNCSPGGPLAGLAPVPGHRDRSEVPEPPRADRLRQPALPSATRSRRPVQFRRASSPDACAPMLGLQVRCWRGTGDLRRFERLVQSLTRDSGAVPGSGSATSRAVAYDRHRLLRGLCCRLACT